MLWIMLVIVTSALTEIQAIEEKPTNRMLVNELSLSYDHCRAPQTLNPLTWTCECPSGLTKKGDECVCEDCLFETKDETYTEKDRDSLPEYVASFLKDMNLEEEEEKKLSGGGGGEDDDKTEISHRMFHNCKGRRKNKKGAQEKRIRKYLKMIMIKLESLCDDCNEERQQAEPTWRSGSFTAPRVLKANKESAFLQFLKGVRLGYVKKQGPKIRLRKVNWDRARILNLKKEKKIKQEEEGKGFSDSTMFNRTRGSVSSGDEKAFGSVSNLFGSGSISLGAGGGSAAASAFNGEGMSIAGAESLGAKAYGMGLIGKKAYHGSSTATLLIGEGDAIATNALSKKSAASATAVATKITASAGSAAFGAATASASATPGKGSASGFASYGEDLTASSTVTGKNKPVAESASSGNPNDDLELYLKNQKAAAADVESGPPEESQKNPESDVFDVGNEDYGDWFK